MPSGPFTGGAGLVADAGVGVEGVDVGLGEGVEAGPGLTLVGGEIGVARWRDVDRPGQVEGFLVDGHTADGDGAGVGDKEGVGEGVPDIGTVAIQIVEAAGLADGEGCFKVIIDDDTIPSTKFNSAAARIKNQLI